MAEAAQAAPPSVVPQAAPPVAPAPSPPVETDTDNEVVVRGRSKRGDPFEAVNEATFDVTQAVDKAIVAPAAKGYRKVVPQPLRAGLRNVLSNLREPAVFFNYVLQHKIGKAFETAGRFAVNTTIGLVGIFDVAKRKPFRLPHRRNGFANTLGFYGVKPGPFLFVPLIGPTTLRDLIGNVVDQVAVPIAPVQPLRQGKAAIPIAILSSLDYRAEFNEELERQRATGDAYLASRNSYLERREEEIEQLRGKRKMPTLPVVVPPGPPLDSKVQRDIAPLLFPR